MVITDCPSLGTPLFNCPMNFARFIYPKQLQSYLFPRGKKKKEGEQLPHPGFCGPCLSPHMEMARLHCPPTQPFSPGPSHFESSRALAKFKYQGSASHLRSNRIPTYLAVLPPPRFPSGGAIVLEPQPAAEWAAALGRAGAFLGSRQAVLFHLPLTCCLGHTWTCLCL